MSKIKAIFSFIFPDIGAKNHYFHFTEGGHEDGLLSACIYMCVKGVCTCNAFIKPSIQTWQ